LNSNNNQTIEIVNLSKYIEKDFGYRKLIFENLSFKIQTDYEHKIFSFLSPFGSGKTTLLKLICGLEKPSSGEIYFNNELLDISKKEITFIPTFPSSLPWLSVKENLELIFKINSKKIDYELINETIKLVGLDGYENFTPNKNSIGFRLRISLARAILNQPSLILLDEPFGKLDYETKNEIYNLLTDLKLKLNISFIIATSSISESVELSDEIFVLNPNNFSEMISIDCISDSKKIKDFNELQYKEKIYIKIIGIIGSKNIFKS